MRLGLALAPVVAVLAGCAANPGGDDAGANDGGLPQGPTNPSFEVAGSSADEALGWSASGTYTGGACPLFSTPTARPQRVTGTAFMPTAGTSFLRVQPDRPGEFVASQNDVRLDRATTLTFDYELSGQLGGEASASDVTVELLFTSAGTQTLWQRQYTHQLGSVTPIPAVQRRDEVITLTPTPNPGRLMLRVTTSCNGAGTNSTQFSFALDNLRTQ